MRVVLQTDRLVLRQFTKSDVDALVALDADEPELGYRLRRSAWGRGYATEGSQALIDQGLADSGRSAWSPRPWRSTLPHYIEGARQRGR